MNLENQIIYYEGYDYPISGLILASKDFKVIELEIAYIYQNDSITPDNSMFEFARHMKLVMNADLDFPIMLSPVNSIIDGRHRLVKAIYKGIKTIKTVKFDTMPHIGFKST